MWRYLPELLERPVPRYTSYPTAAEFAPLDGPGLLRRALAALPTTPRLSLYLHIPFCQEICWYCGCNTARANRAERLQAYVEALTAEIALVRAAVPSGARLARVAFGGGSPNALAPGQFLRLVEALVMAFGTPEALSVETDPRTLTPAFARALGEAGLSHASLGVQTFDPAIQARIGRVQDRTTVARAIGWLREAGAASLNLDLMYGLPGQTRADVEAACSEAVELGADRVALFGYAHVPTLVPRQRRIAADALPGAEARFRMAEAGHAVLTGFGLAPVGFDHFARSTDGLARAARAGRLRRNFQGFTDDDADAVLGLGASAISVLPDLLLQNEKNSGRYRMLALGGRLPGSLGVERSRDDQARGAVITAILCRGEAELPRWCEDPDVERALLPFRSARLVSVVGGRLTLAADALPDVRAIAAAFDRYRTTPPSRFSSAI